MNKNFSNILKQSFSAIFLSLILLLIGCGGSGISDIGVSSNSISRIGSGLGGTGTGEITAFGSIFVNDIRKFEINSNTELFIDHVLVSEEELRQRGLGFFVHVYVGKDVNDEITSGTALSVFASNVLKGPITSINPLQVFEQTIDITGDTILVNSKRSELSVGDIIEVSGYIGIDNNVQATRLEYKPSGTDEWKLSGAMRDLSATQFNIGRQVVNIGNVIPKECKTGLQNGLNVEVIITPDDSFVAGRMITTVTGIECADVTLYIPNDIQASILKANFEGFISSVNAAPITRMIVNNQIIHISPTTTFISGSIADLVVGARIEAEGTVNTATHELTANKIRFRQPRVRIEAPLNVPTTGLTTPFMLMDTISINITANTRNELSKNGQQQVEVQGFVDKTGKVFAERIRERGVVDFAGTHLRGPLSSVNSSQSTFTILGVTVDVNDAKSIKDNDGNIINLNQFFTQVTKGTLIQIGNGVFSSNPAIIRNAEIEIEE